MNDWIDLSALAKIIIGALICGAGLPALFAVGLRLLHAGSPTTSAAGSDRLVGNNPAAIAAACVCFLVVLAAVAWGIYLIVNS